MLVALGAGGLAAQQTAPRDARKDADEMSMKIARIVELAERPRAAGAPPIRTAFTEREANAYIEVYGPDFLPDGVDRPRVSLGANGRVAARAVVDLDAVRLNRERSLFDPLSLLTGRVEVVASGNVAAMDGRGLIRFESATVGGVSVPKTIAQELLRFYTRSELRPQGFAFDEPFDMPANIRAVTVEHAQASVVQ